ncbi:substrate-binding domain-containing protein [Erythrobacter sp.]|uniref:substrate-binding domain-containing protein n=1 Tax=Erythrobacter sp. TaxID=1042 RepID=UPI001425CD92|nr:substrate-binding domain-containing protein [Erythrobacter sp.]QIQ87290.1 MAG: phosphate ABC transporter substrate-binding protein [Erythrobacter sp.]
MTATLLRSRALLAGASLALLAACGGGEEDTGPEAIAIVGSSTVYPFAQKVAEDYTAANEGAAMPVIESTGTGEGIEAFCSGTGPDTPDIVNASRRMHAAEFNRCLTNGVEEIVEIKVGRDGIAFVSAVDEGVELELTPEIVYRALADNPFGEEQASENWSDVDASLPDAPVIVYGPPASSGTREAMQKLVMEPACTSNADMAALEESDAAAFLRNCDALRGDGAYSEQGEKDDLIVRKVAGNPRAVGIFGYSYLEENEDLVKALPLKGVVPTSETIADGSYPAARPLYIYVKKAHVGVTPGLEDYLAQWAASWGEGGPLANIGLVPATEEARAESAAAVEALPAMTGEDLE